MKKIFFATLVTLFTVVTHATEIKVNDKVAAAFNKSFPSVGKASWSQVEEFYDVFFQQEVGSTARIRYNQEGEVVRTIRTYPSEKLPVLLLNKIQKRFKDKTIKCVTEFSCDEGTCYFIMLEDAKHLTEVKANASGDYEVVKRLKKA